MPSKPLTHCLLPWFTPHICNPRTGRGWGKRNRRTPGVHWADSLTKTVSFMLSEWHRLKKKLGRKQYMKKISKDGCRRRQAHPLSSSQSCLYMCICTYAYTCTFVHTNTGMQCECACMYTHTHITSQSPRVSTFFRDWQIKEKIPPKSCWMS